MMENGKVYWFGLNCLTIKLFPIILSPPLE